jgi:hypothetical protein
MPNANNDRPSQPNTPFANFDQLARKLVSVPKSAIDKAEAEYQKRKRSKKRRKPS